jgi:hypothetical protein
MPVPTSFDDLSETPSSNSPPGSEPVGTQANEYIQSAFAFIKQLRDGLLKPTGTVDFNAQKLTNLANGDTSSSSKDAITGAQARALAYKVGEQRIWHGAVANIASVWGPGWQLADGTNGTADMRDKFVVGAGLSYAPGSTGGAATVALSIGNLPAHNHGVSDPGHVHGLNDPGHGHSSGAHNHGTGSGFPFWTSTSGGGASTNFTGGSNSINLENTTGNATVTINSAVSNISMNGAFTGITTTNTGSGTAVENRPPYYASCILEYTGIGA